MIALNDEVERKAHLILVGESEYSCELHQKYNDIPYLHFVGFSENSLEWVQMFDIGLLPTYFVSESLPNTVIEYLACGKPVFATRMGDIPKMMSCEDGLAGELINFDASGKADVSHLKQLIQMYMHNTTEDYARVRQRSLKAFEKFLMQTCVEEYVSHCYEICKDFE